MLLAIVSPALLALALGQCPPPAPLSTPFPVQPVQVFPGNDVRQRLLNCSEGYYPYGNYGEDGPLVIEITTGYWCNVPIGEIYNRDTTERSQLTTVSCRNGSSIQPSMCTVNMRSASGPNVLYGLDDNDVLKCPKGFRMEHEPGLEIASLRCDDATRIAIHLNGTTQALPNGDSIECIFKGDYGLCVPPPAPAGVTFPTAPFEEMVQESDGLIFFKCGDQYYPYGNFGGGALLEEGTIGYHCDPNDGKYFPYGSGKESMLTTAVCRLKEASYFDMCEFYLLPDWRSYRLFNQETDVKCPTGFRTKAKSGEEIASMRCDNKEIFALLTNGTEVKIQNDETFYVECVPDTGLCAMPVEPATLPPQHSPFITTTMPDGRLSYECPADHLPHGNFGVGGPLIMEATTGYICDPFTGKNLNKGTGKESMLTTATCIPYPDVSAGTCTFTFAGVMYGLADKQADIKCPIVGKDTVLLPGRDHIDSFHCDDTAIVALFPNCSNVPIRIPNSATEIGCVEKTSGTPTTSSCSTTTTVAPTTTTFATSTTTAPTTSTTTTTSAPTTTTTSPTTTSTASTTTTTTAPTTTTSTSTTTTAPTTTTTVDRSKCPPDGVWGEWFTTGQCDTTCGSCSVATRKRTCTTKCGDCPCTGPSEDVGPCGIPMCTFPKKTCCDSYVKSLNGVTNAFYCGTGNTPAVQCKSDSTSTTVVPTTTTRNRCPPGGVWSEWVTTGPCPTACGGCSTATRTRTCTTKCGDCPCTGPAEEIGPCGTKMCTFPVKTCCEPYKKALNTLNVFYCALETVYENLCLS